jgi:DNA-binding PadR family transcriptional regulator
MPKVFVSVKDLIDNLQYLTREVSISSDLLPSTLRTRWQEIVDFYTEPSLSTEQLTGNSKNSQVKPVFILPIILRNNVNRAIDILVSMEKDETILTKSIEIDDEDFKDPISLEIFKEPRVISCGHTLDNASLSNPSLESCPCCRALIDKTTVQELPENFPKLINLARFFKEDFNVGNFFIALEENPSTLPEYISLLESEGFLNTILSEAHTAKKSKYFTDQHKGQSVLYLLAIHHRATPLLVHNEKIRNQITTEGLEFIVQDVTKRGRQYQGQSVLFGLTKREEGIQLLVTDINLRTKISVHALNTHVDNPNWDTRKSPLWNLAYSAFGRQLLVDDRTLRDKIREEGLNVVIGYYYIHPKTSALWLLAYKDSTRQLLIDDAVLRSKITSDGLNTFNACSHSEEGILKDTYQLKSPLLLLVEHDSGRQLLVDDEVLRSKITEEGLNTLTNTHTIYKSGPFGGKSVLFELTGSLTGRNLLATDIQLRNKITAEGLCYVGYQGESPLWHLVASDAGLNLLIDDPVLRGKITKEALNSVYQKGKLILLVLANNPLGLQLLINDPVLRSKITSDSLNNITTTHGKTALFCLLNTAEGRKLFATDVELRNKVDTSALNAVMTHGEYEGKSALDLLYSSFEGQKLLAHDATLRSKISKKPLDFIVLKETIGDLTSVQQFLYRINQFLYDYSWADVGIGLFSRKSPTSIIKIQAILSNMGTSDLSEKEESYQVCRDIISTLSNSIKNSLLVSRDKALTKKYNEFLREGTTALEQEQVAINNIQSLQPSSAAFEKK